MGCPGVARVQFGVVEIPQAHIVVVLITDFHGGKHVVHGNGTMIWINKVANQNRVQVNSI